MPAGGLREGIEQQRPITALLRHYSYSGRICGTRPQEFAWARAIFVADSRARLPRSLPAAQSLTETATPEDSVEDWAMRARPLRSPVLRSDDNAASYRPSPGLLGSGSTSSSAPNPASGPSIRKISIVRSGSTWAWLRDRALFLAPADRNEHPACRSIPARHEDAGGGPPGEARARLRQARARAEGLAALAPGHGGANRRAQSCSRTAVCGRAPAGPRPDPPSPGSPERRHVCATRERCAPRPRGEREPEPRVAARAPARRSLARTARGNRCHRSRCCHPAPISTSLSTTSR